MEKERRHKENRKQQENKEREGTKKKKRKRKKEIMRKTEKERMNDRKREREKKSKQANKKASTHHKEKQRQLQTARCADLGGTILRTSLGSRGAEARVLGDCSDMAVLTNLCFYCGFRVGSNFEWFDWSQEVAWLFHCADVEELRRVLRGLALLTTTCSQQTLGSQNIQCIEAPLQC